MCPPILHNVTLIGFSAILTEKSWHSIHFFVRASGKMSSEIHSDSFNRMPGEVGSHHFLPVNDRPRGDGQGAQGDLFSSLLNRYPLSFLFAPHSLGGMPQPRPCPQMGDRVPEFQPVSFPPRQDYFQCPDCAANHNDIKYRPA
jgi:hypothetical protein